MDQNRRVGAVYADSGTSQSANNTSSPVLHDPLLSSLFDDPKSDGSVFANFDFSDLFDTNVSTSHAPLEDQPKWPGTLQYDEQQIETNSNSHSSFEPYNTTTLPTLATELSSATQVTQPEVVPQEPEEISLEELRPVIEHLYKEKTLKKVVEILHEEYENIPSTRTIKRKLGIWGIKKYKVKKGPVVPRKKAK